MCADDVLQLLSAESPNDVTNIVTGTSVNSFVDDIINLFVRVRELLVTHAEANYYCTYSV